MSNSTATKLSRRDSNTWPRWVLLAALLLGNVGLALSPWPVRLADSGIVAAGFWRLFLALPFLALFARMNGERLGAVRGGNLWLILLAGAAFGSDLASWHIGLDYTRLGNATVFANSGSLILMVWGFMIARRLPDGLEWTAIAMALIGGAILLGQSFEISTGTVIGDLFCLLAGVFYAVYLVLMKRSRGSLGSWSVLFWASAAGAPVLLVVAILKGEPVIPGDWTPLFTVMIMSQLIGQGLLVFALRHFSPLVIGLALLTQPAVATLAGWYAFDEAVSAMDVFGMALLGLALVMATARGGERSTGPQYSHRQS